MYIRSPRDHATLFQFGLSLFVSLSLARFLSTRERKKEGNKRRNEGARKREREEELGIGNGGGIRVCLVSVPILISVQGSVPLTTVLKEFRFFSF